MMTVVKEIFPDNLDIVVIIGFVFLSFYCG